LARAGDSTNDPDFDTAFYSSVLHVHRKEWSAAAGSINAARMAMDGRFTSLISER